MVTYDISSNVTATLMSCSILDGLFMARRILSARSASFISVSLLWPESRQFIAQDFSQM